MRFILKPEIKIILLLSLVAIIICLYLRDGPVRRFSRRKHDLVIPAPTATARKVTKSLSELNRSKILDDHVLIMNRIPGSGGELIVFLLESLQGINNYKHIRLGGTHSTLKPKQQRTYVNTVINLMKDYAVPLSIDKIVQFTNFSQFGQQSPTHINIVRDPLDKLASNLNHKATSTALYDMKPMKNIIIKRNIEKIIQVCKETFDSLDCFKSNGIFNDLSVPFFCGHEPECLKYDSEWALNKAKSNVETFYPVVGLLEFINDTLKAFEDKIPYFFRNVQSIYFQKIKGANVYQNISDILDELEYGTVRKLLYNEYDFYYWLKKRLFNSIYIPLN